MRLLKKVFQRLAFGLYSALILFGGTWICYHEVPKAVSIVTDTLQATSLATTLSVSKRFKTNTLDTVSYSTQSEGSQNIDYSEPLVDKQMLAHANTPSRCWVAYKGYIYDVTDHPMWKGCQHNGVRGGIDITDIIPHPANYVYNLPLVGKLVDKLPMGYKRQNSKMSQRMRKQFLKTYPWSEIVKHRSVNSCWVVVDGYVYDVTGFINNHPGGWEILEGCGRDLSRLFKYGIHFSEGRKYLETFKIGKVDPNSKMPRYIRWYDD